MINFREFIVEAFDSSYDIKVERDTKGLYSFKFDIGGDTIRVRFDTTATNMMLQAEKRTLEISFASGLENMRPTNLNGTSAIKVYSTIANQLRYYIKREGSIDTITFEPAVARTAGLYNSFAKMIAKKLGGTDESTQYRQVIKLK